MKLDEQDLHVNAGWRVERESITTHPTRKADLARVRPAVRRLQARGYIKLADNDEDVQCMRCVRASHGRWRHLPGATKRQRPERHCCVAQARQCIHTSMKITASKVCTQCDCPQRCPTCMPTFGNECNNCIQNLEKAYISLRCEKRHTTNRSRQIVVLTSKAVQRGSAFRHVPRPSCTAKNVLTKRSPSRCVTAPRTSFTRDNIIG